MVDALTRRFPNIVGPHREDICYATTNRQEAVKRVAPVVDALLVVGSSEFVEFATAEGSRRALRLQARPPRAARRGCRMGSVRRHILACESRPAPRRRKFLSRKSWTLSPSGSTCRSRRYRRRTKASSFHFRASCARSFQARVNTALSLHRNRRRFDPDDQIDTRFSHPHRGTDGERQIRLGAPSRARLRRRGRSMPIPCRSIAIFAYLTARPDQAGRGQGAASCCSVMSMARSIIRSGFGSRMWRKRSTRRRSRWALADFRRRHRALFQGSDARALRHSCRA